MRNTTLLIAAIFVVQFSLPARADEKLKGIACRSVHLQFPIHRGSNEQGLAFYNEVTIRQSAPGTYFMVCGWNKGYFGLQELADGKKLLLFSVWDSGQNNPNAVDKDKRTKLLHKDEAVRIGRFGGEGTGGQSFFDYDWKTDETYRLMVTAKVDGERTAYAGYFFVPETKSWKHLVTFSTITGGKDMFLEPAKQLNGYYSFVEDFRRNRISATKVRLAEFGNGWVCTVSKDWRAVDESQFTADSNPVLNINAGKTGRRFFLATGGETKNTDLKLRQFMEFPGDKNRKPPQDLPGIE